MSYDFHLEADAGGTDPPRPYFEDVHPALDGDGMAGTVVMTARGYARCGNYTSNVSGMWKSCLTAATELVPDPELRALYERWRGDDAVDRGLEPNVEHLRLRDLIGKRGEDLAPLLAAAVEWGIEHIDELRERNPENGWGNADGAVTYLWDIQRMCEAHPRARLAIWS